MKNNLLSLGQLLEKGYTMTKHNHIKVYDSKQRPILKAPFFKNRTFKINLDATAIQCMLVVNVLMLKKKVDYDITGLGILNFKSLNMLNNEKIVRGLPSIHYP